MVVMAGFALAFHAVFFLCEPDTLLGGSFGTFASALLYVFEAPLGEFDFGDFNDVRGQCPDHPSPGQASDAGIFLLVVSTLCPPLNVSDNVSFNVTFSKPIGVAVSMPQAHAASTCCTYITTRRHNFEEPPRTIFVYRIVIKTCGLPVVFHVQSFHVSNSAFLVREPNRA